MEAMQSQQSYVEIDRKRLNDFVEAEGVGWASKMYNWDFELPEQMRTGLVDKQDAFDIAHYWFITTAINFCYWEKTEDGFRHWDYEGKLGSSGMAQMMIDIHKEGYFPNKINDADKLFDFFLYKFLSLNMPYAEERAKIIASLADSHNFRKLFSTSYDVAYKRYNFTTEMAWKLANMYPKAYNDVFLKKAQLLLGMLAANFADRDWGVKTELTAYSDYRIPQVLRHLGILKYDIMVSHTVDNQELIEADGHVEWAIRSSTIVACNELIKKFNQQEPRDVDITGPMLDQFLFLQTREDAFKKDAKPFHLCVTTDY
jgi:hypothetical protein